MPPRSVRCDASAQRVEKASIGAADCAGLVDDVLVDAISLAVGAAVGRPAKRARVLHAAGRRVEQGVVRRTRLISFIYGDQPFVCLAAHVREFPGWTPLFVKLLLPPRHSRGVSLLTSGL